MRGLPAQLVAQVSYTTSTGPTPTPTPTASPTPTPTATATPAAERRYLPLILRSVSHGQPSQGHLPLVMRE
ncbi:MAG: hypothetical protein NZ528_03420 [Caldilineales bacterium]|nr:hypothetical protein [Caldilineales bacterium]